MKKLFLLSVVSFIMLSCGKEKAEIYLVKVNQISTNAPTITEQVNDDFEITWKRNGIGIYQGDFKEKLSGNYSVEISQSSNVNSEVRANLNDEYVQIYSLLNGEFSDDVLKDVVLKISVYKK